MKYTCVAKIFTWVNPNQPPVCTRVIEFVLQQRDSAYKWHANLGQIYINKNGQKFFLSGFIK